MSVCLIRHLRFLCRFFLSYSSASIMLIRLLCPLVILHYTSGFRMYRTMSWKYQHFYSLIEELYCNIYRIVWLSDFFIVSKCVMYINLQMLLLSFSGLIPAGLLRACWVFRCHASFQQCQVCLPTASRKDSNPVLLVHRDNRLPTNLGPVWCIYHHRIKIF